MNSRAVWYIRTEPRNKFHEQTAELVKIQLRSAGNYQRSTSSLLKTNIDSAQKLRQVHQSQEVQQIFYIAGTSSAMCAALLKIHWVLASAPSSSAFAIKLRLPRLPLSLPNLLITFKNRLRSGKRHNQLIEKELEDPFASI